MKISILAAVFGLFLFHANHSFAQGDGREVPANAIKLNVGSLFLAHLNLSYQRALGNHFAVQVSGLYGSIDVPTEAAIQSAIGVTVPIPFLKSVNYQGWGIVPELRYYPLSQGAPRGWYFNAFYQYREGVIKNCLDRKYFPTDQDVKNYTLKFTTKYTGMGIGTGYQFMFGPGKRIVIDANVGLKYSNVTMQAGWDGHFDLEPIRDPLKPTCTDCYIFNPTDTQKAEDYINNDIINQFNNKQIGLGFLSYVDIFRSALYVGYAF